MYQISHRSARLIRVLSIFFIGIGILLSIEIGITFIFNPYHVLGGGDFTHHLFAVPLLLTHSMFPILLNLLLEIILLLPLSSSIAKTLALFAYLRDLQKAQLRSHLFYFPLTGLPLITADTSHLTALDLTIRKQQPHISILELVKQQKTHQLLLGVPGAGKTTVLRVYQYSAAKRPWAIVFGRDKLPIYIPMNDYNLFLQKHQAIAFRASQEIDEEGTLLDYLLVEDQDLPAMRHIRPYLKKLIERGQVLFLCDGLNEIDSAFLAFVGTKLSQLMSQIPANRVVMTCREVDYEEHAPLRELAGMNAVDRLLINPLEHEQIEQFIEEYIKQSDQQLWHTNEEIMQMIDLSSLRIHCTNPMMLFNFIQVIEDPDTKLGEYLYTRGRLMNEFVDQLISRELKKPRWSKAPPEKQDVLLFLGEVASAARWASERNAIQLPASTARARGKARYQQLAEALQYWLYDNPAHVPFALDEEDNPLADYLPQHEQLGRETLTKLVDFALNAALISINESGKMSFRHEMIAEYFVAYYFWKMDSIIHPPLPLREELFTEVGRWNEPLTIWAGLVDDPKELAKRFAAFGKSDRSYISEAITFSMNCMGVLWTPFYFQQTDKPSLPPIVEEVLASAVQNATVRTKLASIFNSSAQKGGKEVYLSLLPLLTFPGVNDLLVLLDKTIVPDLLFDHLEVIINDISHEEHVKNLVGVLRRFGAISVSRAALLSQAGRGRRLRAAAINILGGTNEESAVEPLMECLSDTDPIIVEWAEKALIRLGPEYTLTHVVQALQDREPTPERPQVHQTALRILERFLADTRAERKVAPLQFRRILQVLIPVLSSNYANEAQQKAREILKQQSHALEEDDRGKEVLEALILNLSTADELMASNIIWALQEIGSLATPGLLEHLPRASEAVRTRIIKVFEGVRDPLALPRLLRLVADPSPKVQQQVTSALQAYSPESITSLIQQVLFDDNQRIAEKSATMLNEIKEAAGHVMQALFPIVPERTQLLVQVLGHADSPQAIPLLIKILETPQIEPTLVQAVIDVLGQYQEKQVVPPLLRMLASPEPRFHEKASNALIHLGKIALDDLIATLAVKQEPITIHRIKQVLYFMEPFPGEELISQLSNASDEQARYIMDVFLMKKKGGANVLSAHLRHPDPRIRNYVRQALDTLGVTDERATVQVMVDRLNFPTSRADSAEFLLKHTKEAIPQLVNSLSDAERGDAAKDILLQFGPVVFPSLILGLEDPDAAARERARRIIVTLVFQQPELMPQVIQMLKPPLPKHAYEALIDILTNDLATFSLPALLKGLEDTDLITNISPALKRFVKKHDVQSNETLNGLREALRREKQRRGARFALVELDVLAVPIIGELITDPEESVAEIAQNILRELGGSSLAFIWKSYNDTDNPERGIAALRVFHNMTTTQIKEKLVELLTSERPENISMGIGLLLERVIGGGAPPSADHEIIPALLGHMQTHNDDLTSLRIIAWLLLLGGNIAVNHIARALQAYPTHQERLARTFLLLGKEAEGTLVKMLHQPTTSSNPKLKAEVAGVLGMIKEHPDVSAYALAVGKHGYSTSTRSLINAQELAISLRALGGLLAGGSWQISNLEDLRRHSTPGSPERELLNILLGKLYTPIIKGLEKNLTDEKNARKADEQEYTTKLQDLSKQVTHLQTSNSGLQASNVVLKISNQTLEESNRTLQERNAYLESILQQYGIQIP